MQSNQKINIAIDGYSSCGKSTLTKQLAKHFNYKFIDTGAMYRAVTLYFLNHNISINNKEQVDQALNNIQLNFKQQGEQSFITLNGQLVEEEIRSMRVSGQVSEVAEVSAVRKFLVKQQREIAIDKGVVMDGRDIGTVVLPNAELKLFVTADKVIRVQRRLFELRAKGQNITEEEVRKNLEHRDYIDSHRKDSPLTKADDAILIDNSNLGIDEQFEVVKRLVLKRLASISNEEE